MTTKPCFKCGAVLPLDAFYTHPGMTDGHLNKCKTCTKADVKAAVSTPKGKARERVRNASPARVQARAEYAQTEAGRRAGSEAKQRWKENNLIRRAAHLILNNAVTAGKVTREPCVICGSTRKVHGHHEDYTRPLDVVWLCPRHHRQRHEEINATKQ